MEIQKRIKINFLLKEYPLRTSNLEVNNMTLVRLIQFHFYRKRDIIK